MTDNPKEMQGKTDLARRTFLGGLALAGAGAVLASCGTPEEEPAGVPAERMVPGPKIAPDGPPLKAGLVGCGGRGSGAAQDFLAAGPNLQLTALGDVFGDRLEDCRKTLRENLGVEVADEACFVGFDAYQRLIDSGVDIVLLASPPHFRPRHFEAAVTARKHVFMEKPLAADPVGVRSILTTSDRADAFGLSVVTGTQFRHQKSFIETYNRISEGAIGEILAARC